MAPEPVRLNHLLAAAALVVAIETAARFAAAAAIAPGLICTGLARILIIVALLFVAKELPQGLGSIGLARPTLFSGMKKGLLWSAAFGALAFFGLVGCKLFDIDPLALVSDSLPGSFAGIIVFYLVGAGLAPVAEEIFFRGVLFGWLRRWGPTAAVIGSTLIFVAVHSQFQPIPFTQLIGGLVFAISYELEKNLMVPIVIHACGNAALFSLSLIS